MPGLCSAVYARACGSPRAEWHVTLADDRAVCRGLVAASAGCRQQQAVRALVSSKQTTPRDAHALLRQPAAAAAAAGSLRLRPHLQAWNQPPTTRRVPLMYLSSWMGPSTSLPLPSASSPASAAAACWCRCAAAAAAACCWCRCCCCGCRCAAASCCCVCAAYAVCTESCVAAPAARGSSTAVSVSVRCSLPTAASLASARCRWRGTAAGQAWRGVSQGAHRLAGRSLIMRASCWRLALGLFARGHGGLQGVSIDRRWRPPRPWRRAAGAPGRSKALCRLLGPR